MTSRTTSSRIARTRRLSATVLAAAAGLLSGCAGGDAPKIADVTIAPAEPTTQVSMDAFASKQSTAAITPAPTKPTAPGASTPEAARVEVLTGKDQPKPAPSSAKPPAMNPSMTTAIGQDTPGDVRTNIGPPPKPDTGASPITVGVSVDSLVGQVNGKPIYAADLLEPYDKEFKQLLQDEKFKNNIPAWQNHVRKTLNDRITVQLMSELFASEARATLPPEQRQGLFAFLGVVREQVVSEYGGSDQLANERLIEEQKGGIEAEVIDRRNRALVELVVHRFIRPRVNVSWKDVQKQYAREIQKDPNASDRAHIRRIYVKKTEEAKIALITEALKVRPFADVAKEYSERDAEKGGLIDISLQNMPYDKAPLFGPVELNSKAQSLSVGQVVGPFPYDDSMVWMTLDSIVPGAATPLEKVQLPIYRSLVEQKFSVERERYFLSLLKKGSNTDISEMVEKTLRFAEQRYLGAGRAAAAPARP